MHPSGKLTIVPATAESQAAALQLVFEHLPEPDRTTVIQSLLATEAEPNRPGGLFEARRDERLVGAVWAQLQPGAVAVVWPPHLASEEQNPQVSRALLDASNHFLQDQQVVMAQTLLTSPDDPSATDLKIAGFSYLADLIYMVCGEERLAATALPDELEFEPYRETQHARLAQLVLATYVETQDCPELNGVRQIEDVLAGYRATGCFQPELWAFARHQGQDVGCVLLADHPQAEQVELVYMGLLPEARGQGFGRQIAQYSQAKAYGLGRRRLILAVDGRNEPALRAYQAGGFLPWDRRSVFLRIYRT